MKLEFSLEGKLPKGMDEDRVREAVLVTCRAAKVKYATCSISVAIVSEARIQALNKQHRGKDSVTDVLSFRQDDAKAFVVAKDVPHELGDIFICLPQVRRQAKKIGRAVEDEFLLMVVHGTLHLI